MRHGQTRHPHGGSERLIDRLLPLCVGCVHQPLAARHRHVVDEDVDTAERFHRLGHYPLGTWFGADIGRDSEDTRGRSCRSGNFGRRVAEP
jgi:hypothetical protein